MTVNDEFTLQIQANTGAHITSVRLAAPNTVAGPMFIRGDETMTAAQIRERFMGKILTSADND